LSMSEFEELLREDLLGTCSLTSQQTGLLETHFGLLNRWNRTLNLTSVRDMKDAVSRHYCESLFLAAHLPENCKSVADLGSGAGFPGIPLAILRPQCKVTLIESHQRKAVFLKEATRHLGNVLVQAKRAEAVSERFDWLVSRAVAPKEVLRFVPGLASNLALLLAQEDASKLLVDSKLRFEEPVAMPWLARSVLLFASHVPRETC
jgi:16S rRNA (guanine(527)-N(7))-methyltransferase RsmG